MILYSIPGIQPRIVRQMLIQSEHPQPRSRNTATGGRSQAQMILQQSKHVTVMVGSVGLVSEGEWLVENVNVSYPLLFIVTFRSPDGI